MEELRSSISSFSINLPYRLRVNLPALSARAFPQTPPPTPALTPTPRRDSDSPRVGKQMLHDSFDFPHPGSIKPSRDIYAEFFPSHPPLHFAEHKKPPPNVPRLPLSTIAPQFSPKRRRDCKCGCVLVSWPTIVFIFAIFLVTWSVCVSFCELYLKNFFSIWDSDSSTYWHYGRLGYCQDNAGPYAAETVFDVQTNERLCFVYSGAASKIAIAMNNGIGELTALLVIIVTFSFAALIVGLISPFASSQIFLLMSGLLELISAFIKVAVLLETNRIARKGIEDQIAFASGATEIVLYPANILLMSATIASALSAITVLVLYAYVRPRRNPDHHSHAHHMKTDYRPQAVSLVSFVPGPHSHPPSNRSQPATRSPSPTNLDTHKIHIITNS
mmetsp:Transcript_5517/g.8568  ORF Transcript_5517/g.8568 Transcript_5517/m.8568 type:complete len:388 (+) Transcript_5517:140-1303(+)